MAASIDDVKTVILEEFPGADVAGVTEDNHRIFGVIISPEFEGKDPGQRNRMVTERVRDRLGWRGTNVGFLLPLAPGETL
jgi:acid stress-induced BolA-like protein IbaG/YrbA